MVDNPTENPDGNGAGGPPGDDPPENNDIDDVDDVEEDEESSNDGDNETPYDLFSDEALQNNLERANAYLESTEAEGLIREIEENGIEGLTDEQRGVLREIRLRKKVVSDIEKEFKKRGKRAEKEIPADLLSEEVLRRRHASASDFLGSDEVRDFLARLERGRTEGLSTNDEMFLDRIKRNRGILSSVEKELESRKVNIGDLARNREISTKQRADARNVRERVERGETTFRELAEEGTHRATIRQIDNLINSSQEAQDRYTGFMKVLENTVDLGVRQKRAKTIDFLTCVRFDLVESEARYLEEKMRLTEGGDREGLKRLERTHEEEVVCILQRLNEKNIFLDRGNLEENQSSWPRTPERAQVAPNQAQEQDEGAPQEEFLEEAIADLDERLRVLNDELTTFEREHAALIAQANPNRLRVNHYVTLIDTTRNNIQQTEDLRNEYEDLLREMRS